MAGYEFTGRTYTRPRGRFVTNPDYVNMIFYYRTPTGIVYTISADGIDEIGAFNKARKRLRRMQQNYEYKQRVKAKKAAALSNP